MIVCIEFISNIVSFFTIELPHITDFEEDTASYILIAIAFGILTITTILFAIKATYVNAEEPVIAR